MNPEYYCPKCGAVFGPEQLRNSRFCPQCGTFLRPKIIRGLVRKADEIPQIELRREDINVHTLFAEFKRLRNFDCGEGIVFDDTNEWLTKRRRAYEHFRELFRPSRLSSSEDAVKAFSEFLYFKNNMSWTTLYRTGTAALEQPEKLRALIIHLQDELVPVSARVNSALSGRHHVRGVGKNIATAILHVCDGKDRFGVWNNRTDHTLALLRRPPSPGANTGETYLSINTELNGLKMELGADLLIVDSFMWYVSKRVKSIT